MKSWHKPTDNEVDRAVALLAQPQHHRYFFERLDNPLWIFSLRAKGFFKSPPPPIRDEERGTIQFPVWPESEFLVRMAELEPQLVHDVFLEMAPSENLRVDEDALEAAAAMPAGFAKDFVPIAKRLIKAPYKLLTAERVGGLMSHLAGGGEGEAALELARMALAVLPDARTGRAGLLPEPRSHLDSWDYGELLERHFPPVVEATHIDALRLLCGLLGWAIRHSNRDRDPGEVYDYSYIWSPAVEVADEHRHDFKRQLVLATYRAACKVVEIDPATVPDVIELLEGRSWQVFKRIALAVLASLSHLAPDLARDRLLDKETFDSHELHHEYSLLAKKTLMSLSDSDQQEVFSWISDGPDTSRFAERHVAATGDQPGEDDVDRYVKLWKRDRLAILGPPFPEGWTQLYEELVAEFGEPESPDLAFVETSWVGPTSPKSAAELKELSVGEIVTFLREWVPNGDMMSPSPEGLGRALQAAIAEEPKRFASEASSFRIEEPTYVRSLLSGLRDAAASKRSFPWHDVLEVCKWVMQQPREIPRREDNRDLDPSWGWARKAVGDLLEEGFRAGASEIPVEERELVWEALLPLTDDPEPTPDYERRYGGDNMDPPTLAINTTRGNAMHAVVQYGLWVYRGLNLKAEPEPRGFEAMPEVRAVLERRLDIGIDPSLAVRSSYGQWFPWIALMDRAWAGSNVATIFPEEERLKEFRSAAWDAYVRFCPPYNDVLDLLRSQYLRSVDELHDVTDEDAFSAPSRLAEHLMLYYYRGVIALDDPLIQTFFNRATATLRGRALEFVGRMLRDISDEVPAQNAARLQQLWTWRVQSATPSSEDAAGELASFGWWFGSGKLDERWAIERVIEVLTLTGDIDPDFLVLETLARVVSDFPGESVRVLEMLIDADREGWRLHQRDEISQVLTTTLRSGDEQVRQAATNVVNKLGARGGLSYGDLIRRSATMA